ncbi:golgi uridine diphosphate-N- acetylglucosamine transporter, partial [Ascosphaera aggregata]
MAPDSEVGSAEPRSRERNSRIVGDISGTRVPAHSSGIDASQRLRPVSKTPFRENNVMIEKAYFLTVNLLNNSAFSFKISVPLHIIVRSAGPVASMLIGYLYNAKRYTRVQIVSVLLLTAGVVGAALADANAKGKVNVSDGSSNNGFVTIRSIIGFSILGLAMVLAAFQGVYADKMYAKYGHEHWREALFYCHTLSLPFFLPVLPQLIPQMRAILVSPPLLDYITETTSFIKDSLASGKP